MIYFGNTARFVREQKKYSLRKVASELGISHVHLCNIENNKSEASFGLIDKMSKFYGIDIVVLAWCKYGDVSKLPKSVQEPMKALSEAWEKELRTAL